ncbi:MAG TPA: hypothetical protein VHE78_15655 [Gemmatimonadaceae bacterium]|nr:hypothetical protein [Gemmatimonadaceae bacterium]
MTRVRLAAVLVAGMVLGATGLSAQAKKTTPVQDSLKALKADIKSDKAQIKDAKKAGDSTKVKALKKDIKADKAKRDSLKKRPGGMKKKVPLKP